MVSIEINEIEKEYLVGLIKADISDNRIYTKREYEFRDELKHKLLQNV